MNERFDPTLFTLLPHRPPMLLVNQIVQLNEQRSETIVIIDAKSPFSSDLGVPSWIGLEYMGQTAALIAGYQEQAGLCEPQLGFLMGSRKYTSSIEHFANGQNLRIICEQGTLVGSSLANFNCTIKNVIGDSDDLDDGQTIATATLSVFRRPLNEMAQEQ